MERYSIEINDLVEHYSSETMLSEVFADIEGDLSFESRVVCRYVINGMELSEVDEYRFSRAKLGDIQTIEVWVDSLNSLVQDVVQSWIEALPELIERTEKFSDSIRTVHGKQIKSFAGLSPENTKPYIMHISMTAFNNLFENCEYLVASLDSLKDAAPKVNVFKLEPWLKAMENMKSVLMSCLTEFEKKNFQGLANTLEFDLIPCFEMWNKQLIELKAILSQSGLYERESAEHHIRESKCFVGWKVRPH